MQKNEYASLSDIVITDDEKYAIGFYYDTQLSDAPIVSIKNNDSNIMELRDYCKRNNIPVFYIHWLAKYLDNFYELNEILFELHYTIIAKLYAATPKYAKQLKV